MSAAARARMKLKEAEGISHFEQGLKELRMARKGHAGRSDVQEILEEQDDADIYKNTQILRKASLTQEQWDKYLSPDSSKPKSEDETETTALLYQKSSLKTVSGSAAHDVGPVMSKKKTTFDLESGEKVIQMIPRLSTSVFFLPLISPWNPMVQLWTHFVLFMDLTYTAFLVPILVGFQVNDYDWSWGCYIDLVAGALYSCEWFINFHVGFIGRNKTRRKLVMDGGAIAHYYVTRGHFFIDTLTVAVWIAQLIFIALHETGALQNAGAAADVYQAVRVLRLVRFSSILRRLYATAAAAQSNLFPGIHIHQKGSADSSNSRLIQAIIFQIDNNLANFFNLLFGGAVLTNFLGCLWNFTAIAEGMGNTWVNYYSVFVREYSSDPSATSLTAQEANSIPGPHRYLVGFYYILVTIATVGYGDIYPQTVTEELISLFIIIIGLIFFGIILGSVAETLQRLSQDAKQAVLFRGRMESVDKWMSQRHLPQRLKNRISNFYAEDWLYGADAGEEVQVMTELPQGLRKEIALCVNIPLFKRLNFFHGFPDKILSTIASHMAPLQLPAGFELCEEGDVADVVWLLHEGQLAAISWTEPENNTTLHAPALVGEVALMQEQNSEHLLRHFSYRTHTSCLLWEVPVREILVLLRQNPQLYELAARQVLPNQPFDYFSIDPATLMSTDDGRAAAGAVRSATTYQELDENTVSSEMQNMLPRKSGLGTRSSQTVTRAELKKSELLRAKSGISR